MAPSPRPRTGSAGREPGGRQPVARQPSGRRPVGPAVGEARRRRPYRKDIEGLRAVAVLAVVFYHAHVGWIPGGYVGVDVFFVVSGYLITDLLWRELEGRGRVSLAAFYGRRMRRLLPAAVLVLVVTMAASARWLPPLQAQSVWKDGVACALYVGNYRFAFQQTNYLTSSAPPSPFQHFWSLGVEEQFYLVWPGLLVLGARLGRRSSARVRVAVTLAATVAVSFGLSLWLTHANEPWAFFSLPTRAWELGCGGVVALAAPRLHRLPEVTASVVGWAGLTAIGYAVFAFGAATPFPGTAALVPVLGTVAVVTAGLSAPAHGPVLVLGRLAMKAIGRISYSWYLWHWPVLIIAPYALGHALAEWEYVALALGSGGLAVLTYRFVETPARTSGWLKADPQRSLATGLSLSAAAVCACLVASSALPAITGHGQAPVAAIRSPVNPGSAAAAGGAAAPSGRPGAASPSGRRGAASPSGGRGAAKRRPGVGAAGRHRPDRLVVQLRSEAAQVAAAVKRSAAVQVVPANLQPPLADAAGSEAAPMVDGCLLSFTSVTVPSCLFGDVTAKRSVVLFGDSHASMWFPAVDAYAVAHHDALHVWTKATCPPVDLSIFSPVLGRTFTECDDWRAAVLAQIADVHPSLVVLGTAPNYDSAYDITQDSSAWLAGLARLIATIRADGTKVVVIGPVPSPDQDIPDCVSAHLDDATACNVPSGYGRDGIGLVGYDSAGLVKEATTARRAGARFVNVKPWFCAGATCPVVVDNLLVYRDNSHITVPYASYLAPLIDNEMSQAVQ